MTSQTALTAMQRAERKLEHAAAALRTAESESSRKRHARRAHNASRAIADARRTFSFLAMVEA